MPNADLCLSDSLSTQLCNSVISNLKCYCIPYLLVPQMVAVSLKSCSWGTEVAPQVVLEPSQVLLKSPPSVSSCSFVLWFLPCCLLGFFCLRQSLFPFWVLFWLVCLLVFLPLSQRWHSVFLNCLGAVSTGSFLSPETSSPTPSSQSVQLAKTPSWGEKNTSHPSADSLPGLLPLSPATRKVKSLCER